MVNSLRARHRAPIRIVALLLLLWVGFDIGAHGLLASDFTPVARNGSSVSLNSNDAGATTPLAPDHCFCHSLSMGAVLPALPVGLAPTGALVLSISSHAPRNDRHPLDHPPQLTA